MVSQSFGVSLGLLWGALGGALGALRGLWIHPRRPPDISWNSPGPGVIASYCRKWPWGALGAVDVVFYLLWEPLGVSVELPS